MEKSLADCRTDGCGKNAECIRENAFFVCRCLPGHSGRPEIGCQWGKMIMMLTINTILFIIRAVIVHILMITLYTVLPLLFLAFCCSTNAIECIIITVRNKINNNNIISTLCTKILHV